MKASAAEPSGGPSKRIAAIDAARGAALAAMAAYHATWDLGHAGLTPENYALTPAGRVAAHGIAGSFLFLVGVGLVLMNGRGLRRLPFLARLGRVGLGALAVTIATWWLFPESYVFFGILHCIAAASVLGLPFVFAPAWVPALAGAASLALPHLLHHPALDAPGLFFLGLGAELPRTNDYVPIFPWFGMVLLGTAAARASLGRLGGTTLAVWQPLSRPGRILARAGRHSLAIYLVHQPLLFGLAAGAGAILGPHPRAGLADFRREYRDVCARGGGEAEPCRIAARCTVEAWRGAGLWVVGGRPPFDANERLQAQGLSQACYAAAANPLP